MNKNYDFRAKFRNIGGILNSCILAEAVARRNSISRRHFESNHSEVAARREEENRRKEIELNSKLNQAQQNNQLLV